MNVSEIINEYAAGMSIAALARKYGFGPYKVKNILVANGVTIRSRNEQNKYSPQNQRKYKINDSYFDIIDSSNKAYLLGFFAADGTVEADGSMKIALSSVDKDFLEKIKIELESDYPIRDSVTNDGYNVSTFVFRSAKIRENFQKYNIIRNKTYTFLIPEEIKKSPYMIDFIRGYWDGDGTVCMANCYPRTSLCSYRKETLESIIQFLEEKYSIPHVNIYKRKGSTLYYFQYSKNASYQLYQAFYKNNPSLFLARKKEKFIQLFGEINSHEPAASQAEDKIV